MADSSSNSRKRFGPLRASNADDYKIDWGGLRPQVTKKMKIGDKVGTYGVFMGDRGVYDERNSLNDLTGKEWAIFTKSWFIHNPPARRRKEILHPAKFPESMIINFINFYSKEGELVLDPMVGSGSTLVACDRTRRRGIGIELIDKWARIASERTRQRVIKGDARRTIELLKHEGITQVDFCITSPPYWNMLRKSRGNILSLQKQRKRKGLEEYYSEDPDDIGNLEDYENYVRTLCTIYTEVHEVLRKGRYMVVICQNILTPSGEMIPFAWDLAKRLSNTFVLKQEKLWLQDNKLLGIWGYPTSYVSNVHHHYCLVFEKD